MPNVIFIEANGARHVINAAEGASAMEVAVVHGVKGIDGDCGGQAACGTCHIFVDRAWIEKTGRADSETELPMLEMSESIEDNSRLACQIHLTTDLDGLILHIPESQF